MLRVPAVLAFDVAAAVGADRLDGQAGPAVLDHHRRAGSARWGPEVQGHLIGPLQAAEGLKLGFAAGPPLPGRSADGGGPFGQGLVRFPGGSRDPLQVGRDRNVVGLDLGQAIDQGAMQPPDFGDQGFGWLVRHGPPTLARPTVPGQATAPPLVPQGGAVGSKVTGIGDGKGLAETLGCLGSAAADLAAALTEDRDRWGRWQGHRLGVVPLGPGRRDQQPNHPSH